MLRLIECWQRIDILYVLYRRQYIIPVIVAELTLVIDVMTMLVDCFYLLLHMLLFFTIVAPFDLIFSTR